MSSSVGACIYPRHAVDDEEPRQGADDAMYAAKHAGGNRCRFCA